VNRNPAISYLAGSSLPFNFRTSDKGITMIATLDHQIGYSQLLDSYTYLDLEVDLKGHIFNYGVLSSVLSLKADPGHRDSIYHHLVALQDSQSIVCGHNFRRFDQVHLLRQWPDLASLQIIDTLELSLLAFPLEPSHRLQKDYKLSDYASNDPLEDARATRFLLEKCLDVLAQHPLALRQLYTWLLVRGDTPAELAYQSLFEPLGWLPQAPPAMADLPGETLAGLALEAVEYIQQSLVEPGDFEHRLVLAALLVWNFERHRTDSKQLHSAWLNHLPEFPAVLDRLFPLTPQEFTYQPFLEAFGITSFRGQQENAVQAIIAKQNPLILMPTGGGKSLCYQLPALMYYRRQWGLTVCICPLQALMEDQVADLEANGLDFATFINSSLPAAKSSTTSLPSITSATPKRWPRAYTIGKRRKAKLRNVKPSLILSESCRPAATLFKALSSATTPLFKAPCSKSW